MASPDLADTSQHMFYLQRQRSLRFWLDGVTDTHTLDKLTPDNKTSILKGLHAFDFPVESTITRWLKSPDAPFSDGYEGGKNLLLYTFNNEELRKYPRKLVPGDIHYDVYLLWVGWLIGLGVHGVIPLHPTAQLAIHRLLPNVHGYVDGPLADFSAPMENQYLLPRYN